MTKDQARALGLKTFVSNSDCLKGHGREKYTSTGGCVQCSRNAAKKRRQINPEGVKKNLDDFHHRNPTYARNRHLKKLYAVSYEEIEQLRIKQNNACGCCKRVFKETPCVDHDHTTGAVRGLLCNACNKGVGLLGDTLEGVLQAVAYLRG